MIIFAPMSYLRPILAATAALLAVPSPAHAAANGFTLVNSTGGEIQQLSIRRVGTDGWTSLPNAPKAGARGAISYKDPDCAFDLKAEVPGVGPVTWAGVNLCDVKSVVLKRDPQAGAWVDYDE